MLIPSTYQIYMYNVEKLEIGMQTYLIWILLPGMEIIGCLVSNIPPDYRILQHRSRSIIINNDEIVNWYVSIIERRINATIYTIKVYDDLIFTSG